MKKRRPRFLSFDLSSKHGILTAEEEANQSKSLLVWLESTFGEQNSFLPVARYVCSAMKVADALQASEKHSELFPCAPKFPWKPAGGELEVPTA